MVARTRGISAVEVARALYIGHFGEIRTFQWESFWAERVLILYVLYGKWNNSVRLGKVEDSGGGGSKMQQR